jgi:hypothetical protein
VNDAGTTTAPGGWPLVACAPPVAGIASWLKTGTTGCGEEVDPVVTTGTTIRAAVAANVADSTASSLRKINPQHTGGHGLSVDLDRWRH